MPTETEKRLARKAEENRPGKAPRYIIVDNPNGPSKCWHHLRGWMGNRNEATVFDHAERLNRRLPRGGVWLLVSEEIQANYDTPHAFVPYDNPKPFQVNLCKRCDWEKDYKPVHGEAEQNLSAPSSELPKTAELSAARVLGLLTVELLQEHYAEAREIAMEIRVDYRDGRPYAQDFDAVSQRLIVELVEALKVSAMSVHTIGAYHNHFSIKFEDCQKGS